MTPKQKKLRRERAERVTKDLPPEHLMGPKREWIQRAQFQTEYRDNCAEWEAELIDEYGFDRAVRAVRRYVTRQATKDALEAERLRNQEYRWQHGNGRLPDQW